MCEGGEKGAWPTDRVSEPPFFPHSPHPAYFDVLFLSIARCILAPFLSKCDFIAVILCPQN